MEFHNSICNVTNKLSSRQYFSTNLCVESIIFCSCFSTVDKQQDNNHRNGSQRPIRSAPADCHLSTPGQQWEMNTLPSPPQEPRDLIANPGESTAFYRQNKVIVLLGPQTYQPSARFSYIVKFSLVLLPVQSIFKGLQWRAHACKP